MVLGGNRCCRKGRMGANIYRPAGRRFSPPFSEGLSRRSVRTGFLASQNAERCFMGADRDCDLRHRRADWAIPRPRWLFQKALFGEKGQLQGSRRSFSRRSAVWNRADAAWRAGTAPNAASVQPRGWLLLQDLETARERGDPRRMPKVAAPHFRLMSE